MFSDDDRRVLNALRILRGLYVSGRPINSGIAGFGAGATVAFLPSATWSDILSATCAMSCITMAGFIINDLCDRPKDTLAFVQRPITLGLISSWEAIVGSGLLFTIAFCVSAPRGRSLTILLVTAVAVVAYSAFAHRFPSAKGLYTALLCCAPLAYGAAVGEAEFDSGVYTALVLFILGREIYLDIRDIDGDRRFGLRTIPVLIGILAARRMAVGCMIMGSLLTLIVVQSAAGYAAAASSVLLLCIVLSWPGIELHRRLRLTRIPMFLGAIALASTVWMG
jgi:geranylgeranylglycerol-phosphate geranylgeranyltransferase